ncbi:MAG: C25 family cysteine peptidase [bacterium]
MKRKVFLSVLLVLDFSFAGWLAVTSSHPTPARVMIKPDGDRATIVDIAISGLETQTEVIDNQNWTVVRIPNEPAVTGEIGLPQLPVVVRNLALPDNANVEVQVEVAEMVKVEGVLVYPAQKPLTDLDQPDWTVNEDFYQKDLVYPNRVANLKLQSSWRGLPFATIEVIPVRYNPARRELYIAKRLRVRVSHDGSFRRHQIEPWTLPVLKTIIDNPERLNLDVDWIDSPGVRYLVIAHSNWTGAWLDSLVNWHYKRGVETRVIAKSSWTVTEVKDSIRAEYDRNNPHTLRWVLLVGEYNQVPGYSYPGVGFSDIWYADLEPSSGDDYFELGIGRLSPESLTDLDHQIQKILAFQKNPPDGDWTNKVGLVAHRELYPGKYSACTRGIYNFPYPLYRYSFDTIMGGAGGTNAMVTADIDSGRVVINYRGHGSETDWSSWDASNQSWTISHINNLNNGDKTPVVINCCCLNHVLSVGTCLGEAWMRKYPGGAVASLGATEASYTIPNHGWDSTLFRCLGDTFTVVIPGVRNYVCPTWDLGWMLCNADAYIVKYYASQGGVDNARMYLWLGDPALTVWTGPLITADVVHPATVPLGNYDLEVSVTKGGDPVKDALVCAWKAGEFYSFGYTDANGDVTLEINAVSPGEFSLMATGQGFPPYKGTIRARSPNTPYVVYLRSIVNDSAGGNGDGCINPGESINLPTWVKNLGDSNAYSVSGRIRTGDIYTTITDSIKSFGSVLAHDSAFTGANGFGFQVAPACTNGHIIRFNLVCKDIHDSIWQSKFNLRVGVPNLQYAGLIVIDTLAGGNSNGRLDPQERANLVVFLRNSGFGNANNVTAVLRSSDPRLIVDDSSGSYGQIMADSTRGNNSDCFGVTTLLMPQETRISCTLYVSVQGGYSFILPFTILVGEIRVCDPIPDTGGATISYWAYDDVDTFYTKHPDFNWVEIRNLGTRLTLSDDQTVRIDLPPAFGPFIFYGQSYNQISICSNGWIAPGSTTRATPSNTVLPNSNMPPLLAAYWDDLYPPTGNGVWYYYDSANHRFIVEWDSVHFYSPRDSWDKFEIILYDTTLTDGDCEFEYQYLTANYSNSSTVGIQDHTLTRYIQVVYNGVYHRGAASLAPSRAILFTPTGPITGIREPEVAGTDPGNRFALRIAPIPVLGTANVFYSLPEAGRVKLLIYDATGRLVRTLVQSELPAGRFSVVWDLTDDSGKRVANGIYLYRLETTNRALTTKAVLVR